MIDRWINNHGLKRIPFAQHLFSAILQCANKELVIATKKLRVNFEEKSSHLH